MSPANFPANFAPDRVRALRERLGLSRAQFAARYHVSPRVVERWEQGRDGISGATAVLLTLIEREPDRVAAILAAPAA